MVPPKSSATRLRTEGVLPADAESGTERCDEATKSGLALDEEELSSGTSANIPSAIPTYSRTAETSSTATEAGGARKRGAARGRPATVSGGGDRERQGATGSERRPPPTSGDDGARWIHGDE